MKPLRAVYGTTEGALRTLAKMEPMIVGLKEPKPVGSVIHIAEQPFFLLREASEREWVMAYRAAGGNFSLPPDRDWTYYEVSTGAEKRLAIVSFQPFEGRCSDCFFFNRTDKPREWFWEQKSHPLFPYNIGGRLTHSLRDSGGL